METPAETAGATGRRKISYDNFNSFPFLKIIVSSANHYAGHGTSLTLVSNVPAETVSNDGHLDDPDIGMCKK